MFLPELVRLLSWTSAKFLPALDSSGKIKRRLFHDDTDNLVPRLGQLIADAFFFGCTMVLSKLSFYSSPEPVPSFYPPSTVRKEIKQRLFRDDTDNLVLRFGQLMAHTFYSASTMISPELVRLLSWTSANILPAFDSSGKISNEGCLVMTRTILSRDSANWWLMDFILDIPWSCLSSFNSSREQVPTFYRPSTAREINQTKIVSRWHGQSSPEIQPDVGSRVLECIHHDFTWARSTLVLNTCQYFTGPRQFRKNLKRRLFRDDMDNFVPRLG